MKTKAAVGIVTLLAGIVLLAGCGSSGDSSPSASDTGATGSSVAGPDSKADANSNSSADPAATKALVTSLKTIAYKLDDYVYAAQDGSTLSGQPVIRAQAQIKKEIDAYRKENGTEPRGAKLLYAVASDAAKATKAHDTVTLSDLHDRITAAQISLSQ